MVTSIFAVSRVRWKLMGNDERTSGKRVYERTSGNLKRERSKKEGQ